MLHFVHPIAGINQGTVMEIKLNKEEIERIILERANEMMVDGNFNTVAWDSSYSYTRTVTLSYEEPKSEAQ
jgi:hypothetical protein